MLQKRPIPRLFNDAYLTNCPVSRLRDNQEWWVARSLVEGENDVFEGLVIPAFVLRNWAKQ
jgi:hypothetical protein